MHAAAGKAETWKKSIIFTLFTTLFFSLTLPVSDPDFWWHLASGKWIWAHQALVQGDPFTIDSPLKEVSMSMDFILKQYWLSQLLFYATYVAAGFKGIILLSSAVFTMMFYTLYRLMTNEQVDRTVAVGFVFLSAMVVVREFNYIGTKPQMWSSLFSVVVIYLMEMLRQEKKWAYVALPALMLVWANLHGGFVLGVVIIAIYCIGAAVSRNAQRPTYLVSATAILVSGINPNGYTVFFSLPFIIPLISLLNIESLQPVKDAAGSINELQSIFSHASIPGIIKGLPYFTAIFTLSLVSFALNVKNIRRFRVEHLLLYVMVFLMGLSSIRFIIFFTLIASFITALNLKGFRATVIRDRLTLPKQATTVAFIAVTLLVSTRFVQAGIATTALTSDQMFMSPYEKAADFIRANNLKGNMFNDYNAGGYLIWRVSPDIKIFIDGRGLYRKVFDAYRAVVDYPLENGNYVMALHYFKIDLVLISGCDKVSGTLIKLVPALLADENWSLVYADGEALLFMRNTTENRSLVDKLAIPKVTAYSNIYSLAKFASKTGHAARMANWKLSMAVAYEGIGDVAEARRWIDEYLRQTPEDSYGLMVKKRLSAVLPAP